MLVDLVQEGFVVAGAAAADVGGGGARAGATALATEFFAVFVPVGAAHTRGIAAVFPA